MFCNSLGMADEPVVSSNLNRRSVLRTAVALWAALDRTAAAWQNSKPKEKDKDKDPAKPAPTVYTPGGDVKPPKVVHYVEPSFSNASKEAFVEGVVKLKTTVTPEGLPSDIEVGRQGVESF